LNKTICLQNNNIRWVVIPPRPLLPPLRNLRITRQQSVALSTAGKSEMQRVWCTQLRHRSYVSRAYKDFRNIFNKIDDDICVQINPLHGFYSSTRFSHESRSVCRYASTSSRVGGGASDGKTCRTLSSVPMTRSKEPRGNGVPFSSNKCAVCVCEVSWVRRRHLDRMSRANSSGGQRRRAACSRSWCHSRSSTSIISRGIVSPTLFYHTGVASSTGGEPT